MRAALLLAIFALAIWAPVGAAADTVSRFDQRTLDRRGVETLDQLQFQLPSWVFGSERRQLALRGVGGDRVGPGFEPAFAIHQDGVYLARLAPVLVDFHDIERIEVARGPQGSLWGRNTAGAMNLIPRRAEFRTAIDLDLEYGNRERIRARGMLNLPLVDDVLAFRVAVQHDRNEGFYRQLVAGDRVDDTNDTTLRAALRWQPKDTLAFDLAYTFIDRRGDGPDSKLLSDPRPSGTGGVGIDDFTGALATPPSVRIGRENRRGELRNRMHLVNLNATLDLSKALALHSVSAYQQHDSSVFADADHSELEIRTERRFDDVYAVSQELRLQYDAGGAISGALGANVFYEMDRGSGVDSRQLQIAERILLDARSENTSWAVFGNGVLSLTDALRISGGLRVSGMHRQFDDRSIHPRTSGSKQSQEWDAVTWRIGAEYQLTPDSLVFARVSTGNLPGGFQYLQSGAFGEEEILAVEVGARISFADERCTLGVNAFWYDYEDIQQAVPVEDVVGSGTFIHAATNVPEAKIAGVELDWLLRPLAGVEWNGSFGYLFAEYGGGFLAAPVVLMDGGGGNTVIGLGPASSVKGNRLVRAPEFSVNTGLQWTYELSSRLGSLTLRGDYTFRDETDFDLFNRQRYRSGAVHIGDLRVIYQAEWNAVGIQVETFVRNVADQDVEMDIASASSGLHEIGFYNTPRLYGGRLTAVF